MCRFNGECIAFWCDVPNVAEECFVVSNIERAINMVAMPVVYAVLQLCADA